MDKIVSQEAYKYKDRVFVIKVLDKENDGFYVVAVDQKTDKTVDYGRCSHEVYSEICRRKLSKNPIEEMIEITKKTLDLYVDKGLI